MKMRDVRRLALSFAEVTEEPHFESSSFRIGGKIFATLPPDGAHLHVFVDEPQRGLMVAVDPDAYEALWWGKKVVGLRVKVSVARSGDVEELLHAAWKRRAPKRLLDERRSR